MHTYTNYIYKRRIKHRAAYYAFHEDSKIKRGFFLFIVKSTEIFYYIIQSSIFLRITTGFFSHLCWIEYIDPNLLHIWIHWSKSNLTKYEILVHQFIIKHPKQTSKFLTINFSPKIQLVMYTCMCSWYAFVYVPPSKF